MPTHGDLPDPDAREQIERREETAAAERRADLMLTAVVVIALATCAIVVFGTDPLYAIAQAIVDFMNSGPSLALVLLYILVAGIPATALHELGHALVARQRLGIPVNVVVGTTGRIAQLQLGQISMSINALGSPARVGGSATFDASRARARDILLIALAGPAASAVGVLLSVVLLRAAPASGFVHDVLWASVLFGVFAVVLNLIPFDFTEGRDGHGAQTDGGLALEAALTLRALR
jgi:hypothetical protein